MTKLNKAERDLLRFAFLAIETGSDNNPLIISTERTKGNAAARARVEHLRELGLVKGTKLTETGLALGRTFHEEVTAARRAHLN
jgi:hypothetical protein